MQVARFFTAAFWARTWAELLYVGLTFALGIAGFVFVVSLIASAAGMIPIFVGLPLLCLGVLIARVWGGVERGLARGLLGVRVLTPAPFRPATGVLGWLKSALLDRTGWRALAFLLLRFPVSILSFVLTVTFWSVGGAGVSYWFWQRYLPLQRDSHGVLHRGASFGNDYFLDSTAQFFWVFVVGLVVFLLAPWVVHGILELDRLLVRGLLGPTSVSQRVRDLEQTRARAVDDSAAELRRIERDLHDGAQARLVALAMSLGLAKEDLDSEDPDAVERARTLVAAAHRDAKETIVELRDLARGIHPPALDQGLEPALATLAARCSVPVTLSVNLPQRPPASVESIVYFSTAELLTNVVKHSGARRAGVDVRAAGDALRLQVSDDGAGGAIVGLHGSGLSGLRDRVTTVDGRITIASPEGGPTAVTVEVPIPPDSTGKQ
jgi:signal transduction histidine kinase